MKVLKWIIMMAGILFLAGCTEDDALSTKAEQHGDPITLTVGMPADQDSRVSYDPVTKLQWEKGDQLILIGYDATGSYLGQELLTLFGEGKTASASFMGYLVPRATQYHLCYKAGQLVKDEIAPDEIKVEGDQIFIDYHTVPTQASSGSTTHLRDYLLLQTEQKIDALELTEGITLYLKNSIMKFNIEAIPSSISRLDNLVWECNSGTAQASSLSLNLSIDDVASHPTAEAYFCFDPAVMHLQAGSKMTLKFNGKRLCSASYTAPTAKEYEAGSHYYINIAESSTPAAPALKWDEQKPTPSEVWMTTTDNVPLTLNPSYTSLKLQESINIKGKTYQILSGETAINTLNAFYKDKLLLNNGDKVEEIVLPDNLQYISDNTFKGFSSLKRIHIPDAIQRIGRHAFEGCNQFTQFEGKYATADGSALLKDNTLLRVAPGYTAFSIPASITTLSDHAFNDCSQLETLVLPEATTVIGKRAFENCTSLVSIELSDNVTTIAEGAFSNCQALDKLIIPQRVTSIGENAFRDCTHLNSMMVLAPYNAAIHVNMFGGEKDRTGSLYLNKDWFDNASITEPDAKPLGNKWMKQTWKKIQLLNMDGNMGIDPLPDFEEGV